MTSPSGPYRTLPGRRYPPGPRVEDDGVNFSVYSRHAIGAELLLYEGADSPEPFQVIRLDPEVNHTFFSWHVLVVDLPPGTHYTWRMDGPYDPEGSRLALRPHHRAARPLGAGGQHLRLGSLAPPDATGSGPMTRPRAVVLADEYDWAGDTPLAPAPPSR